MDGEHDDDRGRRLALRVSVLLAFSMALLAANLSAETAAPGQDQQAWELESTGFTTADGTWLATDVYLPKTEATARQRRLPTVLIRTPYNRRQFRTGELITGVLSEAGYAVVVQDVRGKWGSTGNFMPFVNEQQDGRATLRWIAEQPWSDGRVGMWGSSYMGFNALVLLPTQDPILRTVFHVSGWLDGRPMSQPGGVTHLMLVLPWLLAEETERVRPSREFDLEELFTYLPLEEVFESIGIESAAWRDPSILDPPKHDFRQRPPVASVFHLTGWYDFVANGTLQVYEQLLAAGVARQRLHIGPWLHNQVFTDITAVGEVDFGSETLVDIGGVNRLALRWFRSELPLQESEAAAPGGDTQRPVRVYSMGEGWRTFEHWPPAKAHTRSLFLQAMPAKEGAPESGGADRNLQLSWSMPSAGSSASSRLPADPNEPVPTHGGANFHAFAAISGVMDQRQLAQRADVLTFSTEPVTKPMRLAGPLRAHIHLQSTAPDADLAAKLVVVRPNGYAANVSDGIARVSSQLGRPLRPGESYMLDVDLGHTALLLAPGERLRLELAGSNFPKYERNAHSEVNPRLATELRTATHTIHHSPTRPSRLDITVLATESHGDASLQSSQSGRQMIEEHLANLHSGDSH